MLYRNSMKEPWLRQNLTPDQKRNTRPSSFVLGATVLVRQQKRNKLSSYYDPVPFRIVAINGTMLTAERKGKRIVRNSSFKRIPSPTAPSLDN